MRIVVAVVGKARPPLAAAISDYEQRAARYWPLEIFEVREERARGAGADVVRTREGERLRSRVPPGARLVACDQTGRSMVSDEFARWIADERDSARDVAFVIGGAYGLSDQLRAASSVQLSLSPFTLPHEVARLVLAEQLYRAGTILRGEPYHK